MRPRASSGRRSRARPLGCEPAPHDSAPDVPTVARWGSARRRRRPPPALAVEAPRRRRGAQRAAVAVPGTGNAAAARQRPGHSRGNGSGSAYSRSNQTSAGSSLPAVLDPLEVAVEEPDQLVEPVQVRARVGVVRERVDPVADERPDRGAFRQRSWIRNAGVHVGVGPAGDLEHRALERVVVRGERPAPPVRAVRLLADPGHEPRRRALEPRAPLLAPALAAERRVRRHRVHAQLADRVLALLAGRHAAAADVDVVAVAVVRRVHRQDRPQVRRPELRDLDRREAAVADAPHADVAVAPRLRRQPLDRVVPVERLGLGVLVERRRPARSPCRGRRAGRGRSPRAASHSPRAVSLFRRQLSLPYGIISRMTANRSSGASATGRGSHRLADSSEAVADGDADVPADLDLVAGLARVGRAVESGMAGV